MPIRIKYPNRLYSYIAPAPDRAQSLPPNVSPVSASYPVNPPSSRPRKVPPRPNSLEQTTAGLGRATHSLALLLHNLTDLHRRIQELGRTAVQAHRLTLVQLALAVVGGDTLFLASLLKTGFHPRQH